MDSITFIILLDRSIRTIYRERRFLYTWVCELVTRKQVLNVRVLHPRFLWKKDERFPTHALMSDSIVLKVYD